MTEAMSDHDLVSSAHLAHVELAVRLVQHLLQRGDEVVFLDADIPNGSTVR